jgi:hypothetical protein
LEIVRVPSATIKVVREGVWAKAGKGGISVDRLDVFACGIVVTFSNYSMREAGGISVVAWKERPGRAAGSLITPHR